MNAKYRRLETKFEPETRFELTPVAVAPFRAVFEDRFDHLKARLIAESLDTVWESKVSSEVRRAANEAAALAWRTPYPLLVFPLLFEEKTARSLRKAARAKGQRERSCELIVL